MDRGHRCKPGWWRPTGKVKPGQVALTSAGGVVEALARAIAPRRINVVSPSMIDTPMIVQQGGEREAYFRVLTEKNAIPRVGTSEDVAQAIMFLIHNDFTTGTTVDVDGGWLVSQ